MTGKQTTMTFMPDPGLTWRKSSFSGGGNGACVEVAWPQPLVAVRDSKHPNGPTVTFPHEAWSALTRAIRD
jgi:hypothetical protein